MKKIESHKARTEEKKPLNHFSRLPFLGIFFFLTSCAVSLAPKFDQGIVDNLSSTSTEVFQLLSRVSGGTTNADYDKREQQYDNIIGKLEALSLQINARPIPQNRVRDKIIEKTNVSLQKKGVTQIPNTDIAPSASALENVTTTIVKMKNTDKKQGITSTEVEGFKMIIAISLDQALTYERYLNK